MVEIKSKCELFEKADLHLHLNGLFNTDIIKKVIIDEGVLIPDNFNIEKDLNVLYPKRTLASYLKPWDILRLIPQKEKNLSLLIDSGFENLVKDNITYVELRSSLLYLSSLQQKCLVETLEMLINELNQSAKRNNIDFRLVITIPRSNYSQLDLQTLISAYVSAGKPKEIVGLDLAGNEDIPISNKLGDLFRSAKDTYGFNITIHAGETGNLKNVYEAINIFGADRIGHGIAIGNCERTMEFLANNNICVEVCPISNKRSGATKLQESHPVKKFIKNNVPFVLCSDNPGIHMAGLSDDYLDFYKETKRLDILETMHSTQLKYSFK